MAIGERIRFFRNLRGMTQKHLGKLIGFSERSADVRMAQYETGSRTPKEDLVERLAYYLEVSPDALKVPNIDNEIGLMHTLFALEDIYGMTIDEKDNDLCLTLKWGYDIKTRELHDLLSAWLEQAKKLKAGEIDQETYNQWRYHYPKYDTRNVWAQMPSKEFSDALVASLRKKMKF